MCAAGMGFAACSDDTGAGDASLCTPERDPFDLFCDREGLISVTQAIDGRLTEDATRIGAAAAVGAILGGIFGGGKGALIGVLVGGGGTMAATEGADVTLPPGTILRIRLDQPLEIAPAS